MLNGTSNVTPLIDLHRNYGPTSIENMTIQNYIAGELISSSSDLDLRNIQIQNNSCSGSCFSLSGGAMNLMNAAFLNNTAANMLYIKGAAATISDFIAKWNVVTQFGTISIVSSWLRISDATFK